MHSAAWSILQQLIRQALVACFIFILARRVTPTEFGIIGIANIWNNLLYLFLELGFAAALVQRKEITRSQISAAAFLNLAFGFAIMTFSMIASGLISAGMHAPEAQPVICSVSISFFVSSIASTQIALAQRLLKFKELALRDFLSNSIATLLGIFLAFRGFGVWAVVANSILLNILSALFVWRITPHKISFMDWDRPALREVWNFGASVLGYTGLKHLLRSADSFLVGILFGPEKLGLYNFAQRVTAAPTKSIQLGLAAFLFPRAARSQNDPADLAQLFLFSFKILNTLILIFSVALLAVGTKLLVAIFGQQWESAVDTIRILIFIQLLAPALIPTAELLKATNRAHWLLWWTISQTVFSVVALYVGSAYGYLTSIIAFAASFWASLPLVCFLVRKIVGVNLAHFWIRVGPSYYLSLGAALLSLFAQRIFPNNLPAYAASIAIILSLQVLCAWFIDPDTRRIATNLFARITQKN